MSKRRLLKSGKPKKRKVRITNPGSLGKEQADELKAGMNLFNVSAENVGEIHDKSAVKEDEKEYVSYDPKGRTIPYPPPDREPRKYMDGWTVGNTIHLLYRDKKTNRKKIEKIPFRYHVYIKTEDTKKEEFKKFIKRFFRKGIVTGIETDERFPQWTKIYIKFEDSKKAPYCDYTALRTFTQLNWDFTREHRGYSLAKELLKETGIRLYEADLDPCRRFVADHDIQYENNLYEFYFDIETDDRGTDVFTGYGRYRILSFAYVSVCGDKIRRGYHKLNVDKLPSAEKKPIRRMEPEERELVRRADEEEKKLLQKLKRLLEYHDHAMTWNGINFDYPHIFARMRKFGINIRLWYFNQGDMLPIFKRYHQRAGAQATSFALNAIAEKVLGKGKIPIDRRGIVYLFENDPDTLAKYNMRDADLLYDLEKLTGYLKLDDTICRIGNCFFRDFHISTKIDGLMLKRGMREGVHFPTRDRFATRDDSERMTGAFVLDPLRGIHHGVCNFDFASLYPSMIQTFNISPETLVAKDKRELEKKLKSGEIKEPDDLIEVPGKGSFCIKSQTGFIPQIFQYTLQRRKKYTKLQKGQEVGSDLFLHYYRMSYAYKRLGLSFYGELGNPSSRFYSPHAGESVTLSGQYFIKLTMAHARDKYGYTSVYGDTDSLFIKIPMEKVEEFLKDVDKIYREIAEDCNARMDMYSIELEWEDYFSRILMINKKRYCGIMSIHKGVESDFVEVKGLEFMRSDTLEYARKLQEKVFELILKKPELKAGHFKGLLEKERDIVFSGGLDRDDVTLTKGLSKDPSDYGTKTPHVRVAAFLKRTGREFYKGMKVPFVIVNADNVPQEAWEIEKVEEDGRRIEKPIPPDPGKVGDCAIWEGLWNDGDPYNYEYYWDNLIYPPTFRLLEQAFQDEDWKIFYESEKRRRKKRKEVISRKVLALRKRLLKKRTRPKAIKDTKALIEKGELSFGQIKVLKRAASVIL